MKKNTILLIAYFFISIMVFGIVLNISVYALTEEDLKNKENEINQKIENTYTEIAGIKNAMTTNLEQINRLNIQIKEYEDSLTQANEKLDELNILVDKSKAELVEAQKNYNNQKKLIEKRLISIYELGQNTYLEVLLGSKSLSDFLTKYYILEEISEYDNKLLRNVDIYENAVEIKTSISEEKRYDAQNMKDTIESKTLAMEVLINDKINLIDTLNQEEIKLNEQLEQYEIDKKEIEKELIEIARQNAIKKSIIPSNSGYISPIIGKTKENITTGYYGYFGHTGIDFAVPAGTDIVAVKSGTVVISDLLKNADGTYRSYGEYVVIDHHDGTMTLYAHGNPNSRVVTEGDEVEQAQVIMKSGTTGNSTGPHLHFEVRVNGKCVEPSQYLP